MIVTIRKHAKWLLWVIAGLTIASMVLYMGTGPTRTGAGSVGYVDTNTIGGKIYGQKVTPELYDVVEHDVDLYYLFNYGQWATRNPNVTKEQLIRDIYVRMMLLQKARDVGVHVSDAQLEQAAANYLNSPELHRALGVREGQSVPLNEFVEQVLAPQDLTVQDFENFVRDDVTVQQLQLTYGLPGQLITPQEAANEYVRQNQELSAQIVFFSASNYLDQVAVAPGDVGLFYTNFMAEYRLPDRVQVSYVVFSVSNYLSQAKLELTNLEQQVNYDYEQVGMQAVPGAKTPDDAKVEIRKELLRRQALTDAAQKASDFAQAVFNVSNNANKPASPEDLAAVARQKGMTIQLTAPFSADYGPQEFVAPADFTRTAFQLTPDNPISEPIGGPNGVYVMALQKTLPTEIPPLEQIRGQVAQDLQLREATVLAQRAGTNFIHTLATQMAFGKSFAAATLAAGSDPEVLPPFSMSTQEMPELEDHATINQLRQAALTTPVGTASNFMPTDNGGFVLYVESALPVDQSKLNADLPQFTAQLRQQREMQTFSDWVQREASRELRDTPMGRQAGLQ